MFLLHFAYCFQQRLRTIIIILRQSFHFCTKWQKLSFLLDLSLFTHISQIIYLSITIILFSTFVLSRIFSHTSNHIFSIANTTHTPMRAHVHIHATHTLKKILYCNNMYSLACRLFCFINTVNIYFIINYLLFCNIL